MTGMRPRTASGVRNKTDLERSALPPLERLRWRFYTVCRAKSGWGCKFWFETQADRAEFTDSMKELFEFTESGEVTS